MVPRELTQKIMGMGPVSSIRAALKKTPLTIDDIDLFEINEALHHNP